MLSELIKVLESEGIQARFPDLNDREPMLRAYGDALAEAKKTKEWISRMDETDVEHVVDSVLAFEEAYALILNEEFMFAFRVNELWYRPREKTLEEFSVLRIYPGKSPMTSVFRAMDITARYFGCVSINSGTALYPNDERLARVYERAGFVRDSITLWKSMEN